VPGQHTVAAQPQKYSMKALVIALWAHPYAIKSPTLRPGFLMMLKDYSINGFSWTACTTHRGTRTNARAMGNNVWIRGQVELHPACPIRYDKEVRIGHFHERIEQILIQGRTMGRNVDSKRRSVRFRAQLLALMPAALIIGPHLSISD
jgi:hypothetical protein